MAAYFSQVAPVFKKIQENFLIKAAGCVRHASKGISKGRNGSYRYGLKKPEFSRVNAANILLHRTRLSLCPGLNVGIGGFNKLYAKAAGTVRFSFEKTNFKPNQNIISHSFPSYIPAYRTYMNVIPDPPHHRFKLVEKF